jgi:hypothetical protein
VQPIGHLIGSSCAEPACEDGLAIWTDESGRADQLEVVGLIEDLPMPEGTPESALLQEEDSGHLVSVFPNYPDTVLEHRAFQPALPDRQIEKLQIKGWCATTRSRGADTASNMGY